MSDSSVDYYDVQAMLRDERHEIRAEIDRAFSGLRDDVLELGQALRDAIAAHGEEMAALSNRIEAVTRATRGGSIPSASLPVAPVTPPTPDAGLHSVKS